jgi:S-adenosylmethionine:tRNA ribosyltransferase-isomerase
LKTSHYTYPLPPERIALYPLARRDAAKLLVYEKGQITHASFISLDRYLPENAFLFFNNTKVIPARLQFPKDTGAVIEVFLLHPVLPSSVPAEAMASTSACSWQCTIGNLKRWTAGTTLLATANGIHLEARLRDSAAGIVDFTWSNSGTFAEVLHGIGQTPLPPYIKRTAEKADRERYQTIYSRYDGAVAAPTAGLHFTEEVFTHLKSKNIGWDFLTLHVSAGTFLPVKTENPQDHHMHNEQIIVTRENVGNLLTSPRMVTAVGTTSMRTLESLYWYGAKLIQHPDSEFTIHQSDPANVPAVEPALALAAVDNYMDTHHLNHLIGETSIFIMPGYQFRICKALITNFHQPASTLIMLVAAFIGEDWKRVYDEALINDYRFLSYGDSSLLIPDGEASIVNREA